MKPVGIAILFSLALAIQPALSIARGGGGGGGHGGGHGGNGHDGFTSSDSGWPATGYGYPGHDNSEYGYEDTWNQPNGTACDNQPVVQLYYDKYGNIYAARCPNGAIQYFNYYIPQQ